ncbi:hypothetical protein DFH09DRAFT_1448538 [Mycena vulgaris]|nr:hypothetical protein DFH09DRAFT_1448538 [Mycena vulgaris]
MVIGKWSVQWRLDGFPGRINKTETSTPGIQFTSTSIMRITFTPLFFAVLAAAVNERCCLGTTPGICTTPTNCANNGGTVFTGLCPGGNDNKCCVKTVDSPTQCHGGSVTGKCPGPNAFKMLHQWSWILLNLAYCNSYWGKVPVSKPFL